MSRDLGMNHLGLLERERNLRSKSASFADKVGVGFLLYSMGDSLQSQTGSLTVPSHTRMIWFGKSHFKPNQLMTFQLLILGVNKKV